MKTILYLFFIIISFSFLTKNKTDSQREILITKNSFLQIKGSTNISTFTCRYDLNALSQKVNLKLKQLGNSTYFTDATIKLDNKQFSCGKREINKGFHKLLKTKKHPNIYFELLRSTQNKESTEVHITIEIVGVKKAYTVPVKINNDFSVIEGKFDLDITNFGLTPPKKLFGLIVVREKIEIEFNFEIQVIN